MNNFYLYYLRRPDKPDPLDPSKGQPFYVGKGCNGRLGNHRAEAFSLLHKSGRKKYKIAIIHSLWKQGLDFQEDIYLNNLSEEDAFALEIAAIEQYGRKDNGTGILANLTDGGEGNTGWIPSEEFRQGVSDFHKGKIVSDETKRKAREANLGQKRSDETRQRLRESHIGHCPSREAIEKSASANRGKKRPPESIQRMSEGRKKAWEIQKANGYKPPPKLPHTEETKQRMSDAKIGKPGHPQTEETKQKIRDANLGEKNPNFGKPPSEETKRKISISVAAARARQKQEKQEAEHAGS